jgi:hypothetical protein
VLPYPRVLATSTIGLVVVVDDDDDAADWRLSSLFKISAMRAERLIEARLRVRDWMPREREVELLPLLEVLRAGLGVLPRPRPRPLCICWKIYLNTLSIILKKNCQAMLGYSEMKNKQMISQNDGKEKTQKQQECRQCILVTKTREVRLADSWVQ